MGFRISKAFFVCVVVMDEPIGSLCFLPNADGLDLMESLFQGQLVLRTRCLECESFTERREDFQDISVPVLEDSASSPHDLHSGEDVSSCSEVTFVHHVLIKKHTRLAVLIHFK